MRQLLHRVDNGALDRAFASTTVQRGRRYAVGGHVVSARAVEEEDDELELFGTVLGASPDPYSVVVSLYDVNGRVSITSSCTCPVGYNCKHGAATLLAAREEAATPSARPRWQAGLESALDELDRRERPSAGAQRRLALQFELHRPPPRRWQTGPDPEPILRVRPLQEGVRDPWIKSGASWQELVYAAYQDTHDPGQLAALIDMESAFHSAYYGQQIPQLADAGPRVWPLLRRSVGAGVTWVAGTGVGNVALATGPARVVADATGSDAGDLRIAFEVECDGRRWPWDRVMLLGSPGHGVALLDPGEGARARPGLLLAPLVRLLPDALRRVLDHGPVGVAAGERRRFFSDYLPRLRHHLPVDSVDGSVELPEQVPPRLALSVDWSELGRVRLGWEWRYDTDEAARSFGIADEAGLRGTRIAAQEREILARLELGEPGDALLRDQGHRLRPAVELTGSQLLGFVDDVLPALRASDVVQIEDHGAQPGYRPAEGEPELTFDAADDGEPESTDWLDLEVRIAVDGESLPLATAVEALTLGQDRIFLPSGAYLDPAHPALARLGELVRAASEITEQAPNKLRVGRRDLGLWGQLAELGVVDAQAAAWVEAAQALRGLETLPQVEPVGLHSSLRAYQETGFRWLALLHSLGLGGILADDMGLGKTLQTLALIAHARRQGAAPFLVVAPTSVVAAWRSEAARHTPDLVLRTIEASAARRTTTLEQEHAGADIVVTTYTLYRLETEAYLGLDWGGLVLDEAQQIKNHQGKTYQAVRRLDAPFRLAITGTPFENRLLELWALLSVVAPGLYPSPQRFNERVAIPVERRGDRATLDRFRARIRPFLLRRTKELVAADLPAKQEQVLEVELGSRHRRLYDTHLQRERQAVLGLLEDFDRNRVAILRSLTRLRQLSLDAALVDPAHDRVGSAKVDALVDHLVELAAEGHRALVFSQFTGFLSRVRDRLHRHGIGHVYLDGTTRHRAAVIDAFRTGTDPVFLISLKAGGVGLTLTEADYVFILDPWWNPAVEAQAVDRTHRIGQSRPVMVYRMISRDTIEEKVMALKARKSELFAQVLDGDGAMTTGIGAEDIRQLFAG